MGLLSDSKVWTDARTKTNFKWSKDKEVSRVKWRETGLSTSYFSETNSEFLKSLACNWICAAWSLKSMWLHGQHQQGCILLRLPLSGTVRSHQSVIIFINTKLIEIQNKNFPLREKLREAPRFHWEKFLLCKAAGRAFPCSSRKSLRLDHVWNLARAWGHFCFPMFCRSPLTLSTPVTATFSAVQHHSAAWERSYWGLWSFSAERYWDLSLDQKRY